MSHLQDNKHTVPGDYHGHPSYIKIWVILVALLGLSLAASLIVSPVLGVILVFGFAVIKAVLVLGGFMHLRWEPHFIVGILGFALLCLVFLFFGIYPDILPIKLLVSD